MFAKKLILTAGVILLMGLTPNEVTTGDKVRSVLTENEYVAHEWGTFTSLQGSDGVDRIGLHHGDETLPRFVHCPLGFSYGRCLSLLEPGEDSLLATTQRMETPVIYFYSKAERVVDVKVEFPQGVITEWFPAATAYSPKAGQVVDLKNGSMHWKTLVKTTPLEIPDVNQEDIWHAQRQVDANFVTTKGENEKFIFYRGIGRFTLPFLATSSEDGALKLANRSLENIPAMILLNFDGARGAFTRLGSLSAKATLSLSEKEIPNPAQADVSEVYVENISKALFADLKASGLYPQEAQAMVNTWKRSYFQTPGLRVLYVLPREWSDRLVPLSLNPAPVSLVRTFVGRLEIFTAKEEQQMMGKMRKAIADNVPAYQFSLEELGRFAEPKLWRMKSLSIGEVELNYVKELLQYTFHP